MGLAGGSITTQLNETTSDVLRRLIDAINELNFAVIDIANTQNWILTYLLGREEEVEFKKLSVTEELQIPSGTDKYT